MIDINDFDEINHCNYKSDYYSVRDNGSILRNSREGKRVRKDDNIWTFGKGNVNNGYMEFCG